MSTGSSDPDAYSGAVTCLVCRKLVGPLDPETHRPVTVTSAEPTKRGSGEVMAISVTYRVAGVERSVLWAQDEWERYEDSSIDAMAEAVATMVRVEIREMVDTREFLDVVGRR